MVLVLKTSKLRFDYLPRKNRIFREPRKRLTKAKAGHYIQVITAYLASGVGGTIIVFHEENRSGKHIIQNS